VDEPLWVVWKREGAELLRVLIDENDSAVVQASNNLKGHWYIFGSGNLGHCVKRPLTALDDQKFGHAADKLIRRRSVLVHMVPVGARRMVLGDLDFDLIRRTGVHLAENVVGHPQRRYRQTVSVKVE
jgi:hypothetical protein